MAIIIPWKPQSSSPDGRGVPVDEYFCEYGGSEVHCFYIADSYQPKIWLVAGDSFEDAHENFLVIPQVEESLKIDEVSKDDYDWTGGEEATDKLSPHYNENNVALDTDNVQGFELSWKEIIEFKGEVIF